MTLEEVGTALKAERERRGLRIDDVANKLKISPRLLTALELGNDAALPHPAYVRGFIRSYASLLGISQEDVRQWLDNLGAAEPDLKKAPEYKPRQPKPEPAPSARASETSTEAPTAAHAAMAHKEEAQPAPKKLSVDMKSSQTDGAPRRSIFLPLLLFLLCAATGVGIWAWQSGKLDLLVPAKEPAAGLDQHLPQADVYMAAKDADRNISEASALPDTSPGEQTEQRQGVESGPSGDLALPPTQLLPQAESDAPVKSDAPVVEAPKSSALETPAAPKSESHKLIITAVEECWVHSNADKTDTRQFSLRKGDTFALTFNKSLELKLGNAGGVRLRYDGEDLPPPGTSGQVRTITFPPESQPRR